MKRKAIRTIHVFVAPGNRSKGLLVAGPLVLNCALGRAGITHRKREGDGGTPAGLFAPSQVMFRPEAGRRPQTPLPLHPIRRRDGWCDAIGDRNYNRPVPRPYPASSEALWRADRLYDVIVDLGYNRGCRVQGRGSAIFLHVARQAPMGNGLAPTEGCLTLRPGDLRKLLERMGKRTRIRIGAGVAGASARQDRRARRQDRAHRRRRQAAAPASSG
jgi:L,D-peptidoglycan transpeptidase YkuD (ErfK/YbiS/YcfS/YnhG family)